MSFDASEAEPLSTLKEGAGRLALRIASGGGEVESGPSLVTAFASGRAVVLSGDGAFESVRAFADVFAAGRLVWVPVPATAVDPVDLFGGPAPQSGRGPGADLLDVIDAARSDDGLFVVVLEGFDRAAPDHYLAPLLQCYADAGRPRGARSLALAAPDGEPRRLSWPPNVLLACTPCDGPSALPAGRGVWRHAVLFDAGDEVVSGGDGGGPLSALAFEAWRSGVGELADCPDDPFDPESLGASGPSSHAARHLYCSARSLGLSPDAARTLAFVGSVLPTAPAPRAALERAEAALPGTAESVPARLTTLITGLDAP